MDDDWECQATLQGHTSTVWNLSFSATGERLASCSDDRTVKIWKEYLAESGQGELIGKMSFLLCSRFGNDLNLLCCGQVTYHGNVCARSLATMDAQCTTLTGKIGGGCFIELAYYSQSTIHTTKFLNTSPRVPLRCHLTGALATASGDDAVRVFKEESSTDPDQPVFSLAANMPKAHSQDVNSVAWNPKEAGLLATCSDSGDIAIWRFQEQD